MMTTNNDKVSWFTVLHFLMVTVAVHAQLNDAVSIVIGCIYSLAFCLYAVF